MTAGTKLYQPVKKVFADLREQGCKVGIVTTKYALQNSIQILDKFGISSAVDIIVGAEDVKIEKPDPEGLLIAAGYFGVGKEHVLYVGDSTVDAKTAENAKIDFCRCANGSHHCRGT